MIVVVSAALTPDFNSNPIHFEIPWFTTGDTPFVIGAQVDALGALGLFFVSWTVLMIFIYSTGYHNFGQPIGEKDQPGLPPQGAEHKAARQNARSALG